MDTVTFTDNRIFRIGQRVTAIGEGKNFEDIEGVVIGFGKHLGAVMIKIQADNPKMVREAWGDYDRLRDIGLSAGCFEIIER